MIDPVAIGFSKEFHSFRERIEGTAWIRQSKLVNVSQAFSTKNKTGISYLQFHWYIKHL